ncbi:MAG: prephenate dehydratase [Firmicutes bacterium]|jgi:prephenate dehydratase|nr:prephenate dehydratase [Bacillota bacterium]
MDNCLGFLGPQGTFTEEAALLYSHDRNQHLREYATIDRVIEDVAAGILAQGVVPIENSLEGSVNITLDALVRNEGVYIYQELLYPVSHCLLAPEGARMDGIEEVYSHLQAFSQCRVFLKEKLGAASYVSMDSTAAAARIVALLGGNRAAIATRRAAGIFGLNILSSAIQDGNEEAKHDNVTRFVVISPDDHPFTGGDKTSIVLSIKDGPGSLFNILGLFAAKDINLTRIESRPARRTLGEYLFFIDFEGHRRETKIGRLLEELSDRVVFLKMLGSYPSLNLIS